MTIMADSLSVAKNKKEIKKDLFNFNLFLTGEESTSIFSDMQLKVKAAIKGAGIQ